MCNKGPDKVFDGLLVQQYLNGDHKAVDLLIKRWNKRILSYAIRTTRNPEKAKDIAQEVWVVAIKSLPSLKEYNKVGSWLLSITHNKCMDAMRQIVRIDELTEYPELDPSEDADQEHKKMIKLRTSIRTLNNSHKNVLTLFYLEGMSLIEISDILNVSKGTVKSRLFHAREKLKKVLKEIR